MLLAPVSCGTTIFQLWVWAVGHTWVAATAPADKLLIPVATTANTIHCQTITFTSMLPPEVTANIKTNFNLRC